MPSASQRSVRSNVQYSWMARTVGKWTLMTRSTSRFRSRVLKGWGTVLIQSTSLRAAETRSCRDEANRNTSMGEYIAGYENQTYKEVPVQHCRDRPEFLYYRR